MSHFNEQANQWDTPEKIEQNKNYATKILNHIKNKKLDNVLEVGCGTGLLGSNFIQENSHLMGVDTSEGMLEVFNSKFKNNPNVKSKRINLEEENEKDLSGPPAGFDLIISSMAFHHLKNPAGMMLKLTKLLAPNGVIAIIDLEAENGNFHPDPANMGVHHFGFSKSTTDSWGQTKDLKSYSREIINIIKKDSGEFPVFLATYLRT